MSACGQRAIRSRGRVRSSGLTPGGFSLGADDFVVHPRTTYQRVFGLHAVTVRRNATLVNVQISMLPREEVGLPDALDDVRRVMRIRHGLKLDEPDDFELLTQDQVLKLWDQVSQATFLGLIVISSIALMVGAIGVMAIMSISVTERTREIGVRKALGARRAEILFQFLMEAAALTSVGECLGIVLGSSIGLLIHLISGFPVSLLLVVVCHRSGLLGLGWHLFGMYPALKASRLDPIEALRCTNSQKRAANRATTRPGRPLPACGRRRLRDYDPAHSEGDPRI